MRAVRAARLDDDDALAGAREGRCDHAPARAAADHDDVGPNALAVARLGERKRRVGGGIVVARTGIADARPCRILTDGVAFGVSEPQREAFERGEAGVEFCDGCITQRRECRTPGGAVVHREPEQIEQLLQLGAPPRRERIDGSRGELGHAIYSRIARSEDCRNLTQSRQTASVHALPTGGATGAGVFRGGRCSSDIEM